MVSTNFPSPFQLLSAWWLNSCQSKSGPLFLATGFDLLVVVPSLYTSWGILILTDFSAHECSLAVYMIKLSSSLFTPMKVRQQGPGPVGSDSQLYWFPDSFEGAFLPCPLRKGLSSDWGDIGLYSNYQLYLSKIAQLQTMNIASFPSPAQLSVSCSTGSNRKLGRAWQQGSSE